MHMTETSHFDRHANEQGNHSPDIIDGKRKKSLPVKKLLEIERSNAATLLGRKTEKATPGSKMSKDFQGIHLKQANNAYKS